MTSATDHDAAEVIADLRAQADTLRIIAEGCAEMLPLVSDWFSAPPERRAEEGVDWECWAHMAVLALIDKARAALSRSPSGAE